jgi:hypothetical protein
VTDQQNLYWVYFNMFSNIGSWFLFFVAIFTAILPDLILKVFEEFNFVPSCVTPYEKQKLNAASSNVKSNSDVSVRSANSERKTSSLKNTNTVKNIKKNEAIELKISDDENSIKNVRNEHVS